MCGRYVSPDEAAIERAWNIIRAPNPFQSVYNAAPTMILPVLRLHEGRHELCGMQCRRQTRLEPPCRAKFEPGVEQVL